MPVKLINKLPIQKAVKVSVDGKEEVIYIPPKGRISLDKSYDFVSAPKGVRVIKA